MKKLVTLAASLTAALALAPAAFGAPCADCDPGGGGGGGGTPNTYPTAAFSSTPGSPLTLQDVTFTNGSSDSDGQIDSVVWDFGDGSATSSAFSPTHQYAHGGTYTVTLSVTDNDHATSTVSHSVTVTNRAPAPMFAINNVVNPGDDVAISNLSSDYDGTISSYSWDFGDGATSSDVNPLHSYTTPGMYTVTLKAIDNDGAEATTTQPVRVNAAPTVEILGDAAQTAGVAAQFNSIANDNDGSVEDYSWDFGDGGHGSGAVASHTYAAAGSYTVKLTVIDNNFATGSDEFVVNVAPAQTGDNTGGGGSNTGAGGGSTTGGSGTQSETGGSTAGGSQTGAPSDSPSGGGAQGDKTAPALVVPAKLKARKKAGKLVYTVSTNEAATIVAKLTGKVKGGAKVTLAKAGKGKVTIKLSGKAKKALRAARSVKLTLVTTATDAAGNTTQKTTKVTLV